MFEKESKEYANNWLEHVKDLELQHKSDEKPEYIRILEAHQKGAEFGYNKANEWHYDKNVPCYKTGTYRIIVYDNWREPTIISPTQELEHINGQENHIVAWKEIVLPELKESE